MVCHSRVFPGVSPHTLISDISPRLVVPQCRQTHVRVGAKITKIPNIPNDILMKKGTSVRILQKYEPHRDKTNKMACAPSEDSD